MMSGKRAITNLFAHVDYFPGNIDAVYVGTNTEDDTDCKRKKHHYI